MASAPGVTICPSCGAGNAPEARFCASCGTSLAEPCPNCEAPLPAEARFCPSCGRPVPAAGPAEERKFVTVLFADLVGSTQLGERLDAELLKGVLDGYFAAMREEIEALGGTVEKFVGDAVMAVFGVPTAHEDDPVRALRATLRMRERLADVNERVASRHGVELQLRMGVNTGDVVAVTAPAPGEAMVAGDVVNAAARLEQMAEPGQILVSERTARSARGMRFQEIGSRELRGREQEVRCFELAGFLPGAPERGIPGLRAPVVGRDQELSVLQSLYDRVVAERRPHLATIYGDPGVGKSRLVAEFSDRIAFGAPTPALLRGRCLPYGEGLTYWPLAEILKGLAGVRDSDPPGVVLEKVRAVGQGLISPRVAADPARATAALAYTIGVEDPEHPLRDLEPRQVRVEVHAAWRAFFSALASAVPTVVVVEDIHWADAAMLDLLQELADRTDGAVLFLCPSRPELTTRRPDWGGGRRSFSSMFLEPLSAADSDRLVELLLAVADLPEAVRERIVERAEGNPFFLEEILRKLIDEGRIVRDGENWRAVGGIEEVEIPDTVQAVLAARIDLLEPEEKRALQAAAVVGRVFWNGPVARLLAGGSDDLDDVLRRLEDRELVTARLGSSVEGEREFIFKHVLTCDVAYESLPRRERARSHAEVGAWVEATASGRTHEFAELLAYHYLAAHREAIAGGLPADGAGLRERAFDYALLAAADARSKLALDSAKRLASQALEIATSGLERSRSHEELGRACTYNYEGDAAWDHLRRAVDIRLAEVPGDRPAIARLCALALDLPTRWPGSMRSEVTEADCLPYFEAGFSHVEPGDSVDLALLLVARGMLPFAFFFGDKERTPEGIAACAQDAEDAAAMARRLKRPAIESAALDALMSVWVQQGNWGKAEEVAGRRLAMAGEVDDPWELGDVYAMGAWGALHRGRYRASHELAEEGARRVAGQFPAVHLHTQAWAVVASVRLGEWDRALLEHEVMLELLGERRHDPPYFTSRPFGWLALVHEVRGEPATADRMIGLLDNLGSKPRFELSFTGSRIPVARVLVRRGRADEARELLHFDAEYGSPSRGIALETLCDVLVESEDFGEAERLLPYCRRHIEENGLLALPAHADRLEGAWALSRGELEPAIAFLSRARDEFAGLEARWEQACTEVLLGRALAAAGDEDGARAAARRALPVLEDLRSVQEAARARELLGE